jgi:hypothetical protein
MFTKNLRIFWTNITFTMACPNFKNGPKNGLRPLGVKHNLTLLLKLNKSIDMDTMCVTQTHGNRLIWASPELHCALFPLLFPREDVLAFGRDCFKGGYNRFLICLVRATIRGWVLESEELEHILMQWKATILSITLLGTGRCNILCAIENFTSVWFKYNLFWKLWNEEKRKKRSLSR